MCRLVVAKSGERRLEARVRRAGGDLVVIVEGGEAPHVGCVVLAMARPSTADPTRLSVTTSVLTVPPHREEPIARRIAEDLARRFGGVVVVTAGVHEEGLDREGIGAWLHLGERLARALIERLEAGETSRAGPA